MLSRSGAGATELHQCKFFKGLQFLKDVISNRATHSNLSTPQPSTDSFNRCEYIEDTSTSEKPDVMWSTPEALQSGTETPPAKRKRASGAKEGKAASKDEQVSTTSLDSAISEYLANQNDQNKMLIACFAIAWCQFCHPYQQKRTEELNLKFKNCYMTLNLVTTKLYYKLSCITKL